MTTAIEAITARPVDELSPAEQLVLAGLWEDFVADLDPVEQERALYRWSFWRRPSQVRPDGMGLLFKVWMARAGRGYGKTRLGSEETRAASEEVPRLALISPTAGDARDVMVEGESGILAAFPPDERPDYEPSKRRLTFKSGALGFLFSAEEPERLRGPQFGWAWGDEPASWAAGKEVMDNLFFGLRQGRRPWALLTGTPKPVRWLRELTARPDCVTTTGSTYENLANLPQSFIEHVFGMYQGTRLGRQELLAEWLDDVEGALWSMATIDAGRIEHSEWNRSDQWGSLNAWLARRGYPLHPRLRAWRTIVAVDPPGSTAECGIVVGTAPTRAVAGRDHAAVLADRSLAGPPEAWGRAVVEAVREFGAQGAYVEDNYGGDMVRSTVHAVDPTCPVRKITAKESKRSRQEPVSALYEHPRRWIHHVGFHPQLESQMVTWVPGDKSPDRLDALAHLVRELLIFDEPRPAQVSSPVRSQRRLPTYS